MSKEQPVQSAEATSFAGLLFTTCYLKVIKIFEVVFSILLLIPKTRALGYILIAPICVGIFMFEIFMAHQPNNFLYLELYPSIKKTKNALYLSCFRWFWKNLHSCFLLYMFGY